MDLEPGTVVANRYRISRAIGRGGMGEVFAAENIRTGRPVAVKLLRADSKSKSSAVERFRREARAAGSINSDHVTQVLDVEDDAQHGIVIVFELLEGESLIDRLKRTGPIPFDELHPIIEEVWVGLSDAHKVGIIHRDLKPSNVFLERRPDGHQRVKILDFGISKLPKEMGGETLTEMGQSLGTFSFMPPEQIGRAKTVDHRADIYATTTMIYQSLTGQLPYIARNILVMVELKSKTDPRPLSDALGHPVDKALEAFVAKGLARSPADRFQDALHALEEWRKLKHVEVPESRRPISSGDLNAQARGAAPLPAAGRSPTGAYQPASAMAPRPQPPRPTSGAFAPVASSPQPGAPPAPVVPAAMLEPVMSAAALPRLYDQTESTTDVSDVEIAHQQSDASGVRSAGASARATSGDRSPASGATPSAREPLSDDDGERRGPAGTRVLPPQVVQQAVQAAQAKRAGQQQNAQASNARGGPVHTPHSGMSAIPSQQRPMGSPDPRSGAHPSQAHPQQAHPQQAHPGHPAQGASGPAPMSGSYPSSSAPPPPAPSSIGGQMPASGPRPASGPHPASGVQPMMRSPTPDPRSMSQGQPAGAQPHPDAQQRDPRMASQPPPHGQAGPPHAASYPGHVQLATMRLPDDPSSIPQDQTQVYRPKRPTPQPPPKKKQSLAVYVLGAIAFAIVGFGIVYAVQLLVRSIGQ